MVTRRLPLPKEWFLGTMHFFLISMRVQVPNSHILLEQGFRAQIPLILYHLVPENLLFGSLDPLGLVF